MSPHFKKNLIHCGCVCVAFIIFLILGSIYWPEPSVKPTSTETAPVVSKIFTPSEYDSDSYLSRIIDRELKTVCYKSNSGQLSCVFFNSLPETIKPFKMKLTSVESDILERYYDSDFGVVCYKNVSSHFYCGIPTIKVD